MRRMVGSHFASDVRDPFHQLQGYFIIPVNAFVSESSLSRDEGWCKELPAVGPWASYLTSLYLQFLI